MPEDLTAPQAFRFAFLSKCAAAGLTPDQVEARVDRALAAIDHLEKRAGGEGFDIAGNLKNILLGGLGIAAVGTIGAGIGGGMLAHKAVTPELDPADYRDREMINAYDSFAHEAKLRAMARRIRSTRMPRRLPF